jgi:hypothetical protein
MGLLYLYTSINESHLRKVLLSSKYLTTRFNLQFVSSIQFSLTSMDAFLSTLSRIKRVRLLSLSSEVLPMSGTLFCVVKNHYFKMNFSIIHFVVLEI